MFPWITFWSVILHLVLGFCSNSYSFRVYGNFRFTDHLGGCGPRRMSSAENTHVEDDYSAPYLVVQPPVTAVWHFLSEYLVPPFHSSSVDGKHTLPSVLLSCSGGQDSMAMLHALGFIKKYSAVFVKFAVWRKLQGIKGNVDHASLHDTLLRLLSKVHVVYFDHRTRPDIDQDIAVIRAACEQYGFDFNVEVAEGKIVDLAHDEGSGNFQKVARDWRRAAYKRLTKEFSVAVTGGYSGVNYRENAESAQIFDRQTLTIKSESVADTNALRQYINRSTRGVVLLAHHANDNVETFLFKLLRGVHISNISGMEPMCYLDGDEDVVLARPFLHLTKNTLGSFLQNIGGTYHEDSSNSRPKYLRNRIRHSVLPELLKATSTDDRPDGALGALDKRFRTMEAQSRTLKGLLDFETYMFGCYISSKYKLPNFFAKPKDASRVVGKRGPTQLSQLERLYSGFYDQLYRAANNGRGGKQTRKYIQMLQFLRGIGFPIKDVLLVNEWLSVQSEIVRKDILYKFCLRATGDGDSVDHNVLERLTTFWENEPVSDNLKIHVLRGDKAMYHQGSVVKISRPTTFEKSATEGRLYDDGYCSFRVFDNFNMLIKPVHDIESPAGFHLKLSVPIAGVGSNAPAFDIRQIRDDDVVPCDSLWNRTASSVLAKMKFPQILRDELPVVALRDSNHVVCFYGLNILPPYYVSVPQHVTVSFSKEAAVSWECKDYILRLSSDDK
ncbi:tRNA(Ile)-lysidine synthase [Babesia sp. Xinjiang]|uniref:tRNA(Ile)-lysidine synthase n=1 Tax=Babesia sp. Xinjiang TaxID=462227 RepID=UPI000A265FF7|nr:tRNA(Ile)-lysidine synthase [Babesia sp. Xinjiang]ORM40570.1 tRNA(Ile)-lysidine synthase [Babesia sp. Xinjiang]